MATTNKVRWVRHSLADRYQLTCGDYRINAIALGHDECRSFYVLYHGAVRIDEFDRLSEAKAAALLHAEEQSLSRWMESHRHEVTSLINESREVAEDLCDADLSESAISFHSWIHGAHCRVGAIKAELDKMLAEFDRLADAKQAAEMDVDDGE